MTSPLMPSDCDLRDFPSMLLNIEMQIDGLVRERDGLGYSVFASQQRKRIGSRLRDLRLKAARLRGTHTDAEWRALLGRFAGRCVRCGVLAHHLDKDHIMPLCVGGSDAIANLQPICPRCNCAKGLESTNRVAYRDQHGFDAVAP